MLVLVTYDISTLTAEGRKRLRKVAKACENYGLRVQHSVFECHLNSMQYKELQRKLESIIDVGEDSVRFYNLGKSYDRKTIHIGTKAILDMNEVIIL